ncbi:MAG: CoA pyrophosphatase [Promethearchaeia archaeon]
MKEALILDEEKIKNRLYNFEDSKRPCFDDARFIKSAVIIPVISYPDKPFEILFIKRTIHKEDKHSGEMAFPGGKYDPQVDKNLKETALRETEEEIGIFESNISVLGCLKDQITPKKFIITPFIAIIENNVQFLSDNAEVAEIIKIPINYFLNGKNYLERTYTLKNTLIAVGKYKYWHTNGKKYVIFGASCHILVDFIETIYQINLMNKKARRLQCADFSK